jgi:5-formyltetrahydrofolate cyclo-ligase
LSASFVAREQVWDGLCAVARPDARFHLRFADFIPDFEGSSDAIDRLLALPAFSAARHVFVTPDNSLVELRRRLLVAGVSLVVSSYNMARGFYVLRPGAVPAGHELYAAWLDGVEHFGQPLSLADLAALGTFDGVVTGASAVAASGVRFGRGHGFFDLEWRIFSDMGLVSDRTPVATVVHDVQVLDKRLYPGPDDVLVDWICTPSRTLAVTRDAPRPRGVRWDQIAPEQCESNPALQELRRAAGLAR